MHKSKLRSALRRARRALSNESQAKASRGLARQIDGWTPFTTARRMALYRATDGEIDPAAVFESARQLQISCYLPLVVYDTSLEHPNRLSFAPYAEDSEFESNKFGIDEPVVDAQQIIGAAELDLVLMPLVGFDRQGNRLGMGGGFYDATFAFKNTANRDQAPRLVGLAHACQEVDQLDCEVWDIPLSAVITDRDILLLT